MAIQVGIQFLFARPKSHFNSKGQLKSSAPEFYMSKNRHDIDKLIRSILDSMTGIAYVDDSQVVLVHSIKRYCDEVEREGALISVSSMV